MSLTPEQKTTVATWVATGDNLSAVQKKLLEHFKITLTYRDVRFLVDDLELTLKDPAPKADVSDVSKSTPAPKPTAAPAAAEPTDLPPDDGSEFPEGEESDLPPEDAADLPPADTRRWVASRKAIVVKAVISGLITQAEALERYSLSEEEFTLWRDAVARHGDKALRVTTLQKYRQL